MRAEQRVARALAAAHPEELRGLVAAYQRHAKRPGSIERMRSEMVKQGTPAADARACLALFRQLAAGSSLRR